MVYDNEAITNLIRMRNNMLAAFSRGYYRQQIMEPQREDSKRKESRDSVLAQSVLVARVTTMTARGSPRPGRSNHHMQEQISCKSVYMCFARIERWLKGPALKDDVQQVPDDNEDQNKRATSIPSSRRCGEPCKWSCCESNSLGTAF